MSHAAQRAAQSMKRKPKTRPKRRPKQQEHLFAMRLKPHRRRVIVTDEINTKIRETEE